MTRCLRCFSKLEDWELIDGKCPFCFPRQIKRTRDMTEEEYQAVLDAGCPDCHIPWKFVMGNAFCPNCDLIPPNAVRFQ